MNVSVNLAQSVDLALAASANPGAITRGDLTDLTFSITSSPAAPSTFIDTLPTGLVPRSASAGAGSCTISGQSVSCALTNAPTTVDVAVQGSSPGMYADTGHLTSSVADPNPANNSASTTLIVVNSTPNCVLPTLRGAPLSVAKAVLPLVNCTLGKVKKASSNQVPKGDVISTAPASGVTSPPGTAVTITVSSGRRHRKHHRRHHH